jgi:hypothetical protein
MKPTAASDVQEKSSRSLTLAAGGSGTIWLPSLLSIDLYMPHLAPASSLFRRVDWTDPYDILHKRKAPRNMAVCL